MTTLMVRGDGWGATWVRSAPAFSADNILTTLFDGTLVTVTGVTEGDFSQLYFQGRTLWISMAHLTDPDNPEPWPGPKPLYEPFGG